MYNEVKINMLVDDCDCEYVISEAGSAITPFVYIRMYLGDIDFSAVEIRATYNGGTEWALPELHGVENLEKGWYMTRLSYSDFSKAGDFELEVRAYYNGEMHGNKTLYFFHSNLQSEGEWNLSKQHGVIRDAYNVQQGSTASSGGGGGGGGGATYTAGKGIDISDENEIKAKIDNSTIQFNEKGELVAKGGSGLTIDNAVIIKEADSKYLLHEYKEVEYIAGNKIGYAGAGNQIIVGGYTLIKDGTPLDTSGSAMYVETVFPKGGDNPNAMVEPHGIIMIPGNVYPNYTFVGWWDNISSSMLRGENTYDLSRSGINVYWQTIYPPDANHPFGYVTMKVSFMYVNSSGNLAESSSQTKYADFASEAEYNAAVGLTYEPNTLTEVQETVTEV